MENRGRPARPVDDRGGLVTVLLSPRELRAIDSLIVSSKADRMAATKMPRYGTFAFKQLMNKYPGLTEREVIAIAIADNGKVFSSRTAYLRSVVAADLAARNVLDQSNLASDEPISNEAKKPRPIIRAPAIADEHAQSKKSANRKNKR